MKLSMLLNYSGNPREAADEVAALEKAGLDTVWVPEAYGFDSPTLMGYLAAKTETVEIGAGILNVFSRTPSAIAQTAAGLDNVSQGRALLGLGASGPQVIGSMAMDQSRWGPPVKTCTHSMVSSPHSSAWRSPSTSFARQRASGSRETSVMAVSRLVDPRTGPRRRS